VGTVPQPTISRWLNENNYQVVSNYSTGVEDFSVKRVFTEEGGLDREFLELLNSKPEEGVRVQEFGIREKGSSGQGELKQACVSG
jgi:hypothetical protein